MIPPDDSGLGRLTGLFGAFAGFSLGLRDLGLNRFTYSDEVYRNRSVFRDFIGLGT